MRGGCLRGRLFFGGLFSRRRKNSGVLLVIFSSISCRSFFAVVFLVIFWQLSCRVSLELSFNGRLSSNSWRFPLPEDETIVQKLAHKQEKVVSMTLRENAEMSNLVNTRKTCQVPNIPGDTETQRHLHGSTSVHVVSIR